MNPFVRSLFAVIGGAALASLLILVGTQAMSPAAQQSDAPLISYGEDE